MQPQPPPTPSEQPSEPPFPYGWRLVRRRLPDGTSEMEQVPLTLADVLHPQEDDVIPQRSLHEMERAHLTGVFRSRPVRDPIVRVTADLLIDWGVAGIRDHSPDVALFVGLKHEPDLNEGTFHLLPSGGRCLLAVEIVSPHTRNNDVVHKFREYYQVGVPLYVLVDQEKEDGPRRVIGYRWRSHGYEELPQGPQGLFLGPLNLYLYLDEQGRVACRDAATGRELGDYVCLAQELEAADQRLLEQAQELEEAVLLARHQAQALAEAERLALDQTKAREAAERLAQAAAKQHRVDEERIRELEAALSRLQGSSPP